MGHVIKKGEEQSNVVSASLDDEDLASGRDRIPVDRVASPEDEDGEDRDDAQSGRVLRREKTRRVDQPVRIDAEELEPSRAEAGTDVTPDSAEREDDTDRPAESDSEKSDGSTPNGRKGRQDVEEARAQAYEEGREDGYEEGYEAAEETVRAEFSERQDALIEDVSRFDKLWAQYIDESEPMLVELAVRLAEVIVDAPLNDTVRRVSEEAITEAAAKLTDSPPVTVTVHPVDYQRLRESGLIDHLQEKYDEIRVESDPNRREGDWSVASPEGVIRRLRHEVIETLRDKLRLDRSESAD